MSLAHVKKITVKMQELKTSKRTVGGQYLNGLWTNLNEIRKFLTHMAHSKLLRMPKRNNHDNCEACKRNGTAKGANADIRKNGRKSFWLKIIISSKKNQMEFLLIDPLETMKFKFRSATRKFRNSRSWLSQQLKSKSKLQYHQHWRINFKSWISSTTTWEVPKMKIRPRI